VHDHLGDTLARLGERDTARQVWERALALLAEAGDELSSTESQLQVEIQTKLRDLQEGETPALAPTAAEQHNEEVS
jgi:hypothetical protein